MFPYLKLTYFWYFDRLYFSELSQINYNNKTIYNKEEDGTAGNRMAQVVTGWNKFGTDHKNIKYLLF